MPRALSWLLAGLAAYAALAPLGGPRADDRGPAHYRALGDALLKAAPAPAGQSVSYRMPLATTSAALARRLPPGDWDLLRRAAAAALLTALAGLLGSVWSAPAAALLWSLPSLGRGALGDHVQALYALAALAVALALARRARAPGPETSALLALALGASILVRSPLALFAPLLLAVEARRRRPDPLDALLLLAGPLLVLLPWAWMNWRLHGRLVLLEDGAASANLVAGALGFTGTFEGDARALLPAGVPLDRGGAVLLWALGEAASHPLRTASAVLARLGFALAQSPLAFALAAAAAWRGRSDPAVRAVAGLTGYLLAVHVLLAVQANYFLPAAALASALAAALLLRAPSAEPPEARRVARAAAAATAAACLAAGVVCARYGLRAPRPAPAAASELTPAVEKARGAVRAGDAAGAAAALREALTLLRGGALVRAAADAAAVPALADARRLHEELSLRAGGDPPALRAALARAWVAAAPEDFWARAYLAAAEPSAEARREAARRARLPAHHDAVRDLERAALPSPAPDPAAERRAEALRLQSAGRREEAVALLRTLVAGAPRDAALRADLGVALFLAGRREDAARELAAACALEGAGPGAFLSLSQARVSLGDRSGAEAARRAGLKRCSGGDDPACALLRR